MDMVEIVKLVSTLVAICGGFFAMHKHFSDRREKEIREWQKVIMLRILRKEESADWKFDDLLAAYRLEAQAFQDHALPKKEISENALQRVLLELISTTVIEQRLDNSYRLCIIKDEFNLQDLVMQFNSELVRVIGSNPYLYTVDEVLKEIAPRLGLEDKIPLLHNDLVGAINNQKFVLDTNGKIAFPQHVRSA
ncbi:hypothetical protein ACQKP3_23735 [Vibrio sp. DNB22_10_4]